MNAAYEWLAIIGLGFVTLATRAFFLAPRREFSLPAWAHRAMKYAPLAAMVAIVVPEFVFVKGQFLATPWSARLCAGAAAVAYYAWRGGMMGTLVVGTLVYLPLRLGLGW